MSNDPFANVADEPTQAPAETTTQKEITIPVTNQSKIVTTLKGGSGYDAPWIVVHSDTAEEALEILNDKVMKDLMERTQEVGQHFAKKGKPAASAPANSNGKPAGANQAPAGGKECPPGWTYKSGMSKAGKSWQAYMPPRDSNEKPIWL